VFNFPLIESRRGGTLLIIGGKTKKPSVGRFLSVGNNLCHKELIKFSVQIRFLNLKIITEKF